MPLSSAKGQLKERILFTPPRDGYMRVFAPVMTQLKKRNRFEPLVLFLEGMHTEGILSELDEQGIGHIETDQSPQPAKRKTQGFWGNISYAFKYTLSLFSTRRRIRRILDSLLPAFMVTGTEVFYTDRFFLREAKRRGIPSLTLFSVLPDRREVVQRLATERENRQGRLLSTFAQPSKIMLKKLGMPVQRIPAPSWGESTKISVWSGYHREILLGRGGIAEKIIITGCPAHDSIYLRRANPSDKTRGKISESLGIPGDNEIILFGTQPLVAERLCTPEQQRELTELVIEACARFDKYFLIMKLHPRESTKEYAYLDEHPLRNRIRLVSDKDFDLYDLLDASRVLITLWSTIATDAILFDKDVVTINLLSMRVPLDYTESGAALGVYRGNELFDTLDKIFNDKHVQQELKRGRARFIDEYLPTFDGKATERVVDLIYQLMAEEGTPIETTPD